MISRLWGFPFSRQCRDVDVLCWDLGHCSLVCLLGCVSEPPTSPHQPQVAARRPILLRGRNNPSSPCALANHPENARAAPDITGNFLWEILGYRRGHVMSKESCPVILATKKYQGISRDIRLRFLNEHLSAWPKNLLLDSALLLMQWMSLGMGKGIA